MAKQGSGLARRGFLSRLAGLPLLCGNDVPIGTPAMSSTHAATGSHLALALPVTGSTDDQGAANPSPRPIGLSLGLYLGQVATRCFVPSYNSAPGYFQSRTQHTARDTIASLQVAYANWRMDVANPANNKHQPEVDGDGPFTIHVGIECQETIVGEFKWGGVSIGTVVPGQTAVSDVLTLSTPIPKGSLFYLRPYVVGSLSTIANGGTGGYLKALGDIGISSSAPVPDQSISGIIKDNNSAYGVYPVSILGMTNRPSVFLVGDSRGVGLGNDASIISDPGDATCQVGPYYAYINASVGGDSATSFLATHAKRLELSQYCSHVVCSFGSVDVRAFGLTGPETLARLQQVWALFADKPVFQGTVTPTTTSTDNWLTQGNQTIDPAANPARVALNDLIRAMAPGLTGYFDTADVLEPWRSAGIWGQIPHLSKLWSNDGVHCNVFGYARQTSYGGLRPERFMLT